MSNTLLKTSHRPRIALAGATGRVGLALIDLLTFDPVDVVALTRQSGATRLPEAVVVATVDFDRAETLEQALHGTDRLFIALGTSPNQVANEIALIDSAVAAGVRHIVKLSALGPATRLAPGAWHMLIEAHLARQTVASTVLRPSAFLDVLKRSAGQIALGSWSGAAGDGRVNFIDTRDVAAVARIALREEVGPESQRAYHLTGSRAWTMHQIADELSRLLGHSIVYAHRSPEQRRAALLETGLKPFVADLLVGLDQLFCESVLGETTSTVRDLTGVAPRTLSDWLGENAAVFRNA
jgi:uncharacterized protein YbjT (DUF2867 family)